MGDWDVVVFTAHFATSFSDKNEVEAPMSGLSSW